MQKIPLLATPNQELNAVLADQNCTITVRQMGDHLFFSLWLDDLLIIENAIIMPRQLVLQYARDRFAGNFLLYDNQDRTQSTMPDSGGLESRYELMYLTPAEVEEIAQYGVSL